MNFLIPDKEPKLTEAEIMKTLEELYEECVDVTEFQVLQPRNVKTLCYLFKEILDLINRKNAEIEKKDKILESYAFQYGTVRDKDGLIAEAKAEATKEFVERLHTVFRHYGGKDELSKSMFLSIVNISAKEMGVEV